MSSSLEPEFSDNTNILAQQQGSRGTFPRQGDNESAEVAQVSPPKSGHGAGSKPSDRSKLSNQPSSVPAGGANSPPRSADKEARRTRQARRWRKTVAEDCGYVGMTAGLIGGTALAAATKGAIIGAAIGSVIPGVGTAAGAVIGAVAIVAIGAAGGGAAGYGLGWKGYDLASERTNARQRSGADTAKRRKLTAQLDARQSEANSASLQQRLADMPFEDRRSDPKFTGLVRKWGNVGVKTALANINTPWHGGVAKDAGRMTMTLDGEVLFGLQRSDQMETHVKMDSKLDDDKDVRYACEVLRQDLFAAVNFAMHEVVTPTSSEWSGAKNPLGLNCMPQAETQTAQIAHTRIEQLKEQIAQAKSSSKDVAALQADLRDLEQIGMRVDLTTSGGKDGKRIFKFTAYRDVFMRGVTVLEGGVPEDIPCDSRDSRYRCVIQGQFDPHNFKDPVTIEAGYPQVAIKFTPPSADALAGSQP